MAAESEIKIIQYVHKQAELVGYDPMCAEVAGYVGGLITNGLAGVVVEHVGSTAVAGCDGKGILDLMVLYPAGGLEAAREVLIKLGFQNQPHREPFGEGRPMRVGSVEYEGKVYQLHVHVVQAGCEEAESTLRFRDRLRENDDLRDEYVRLKKRILQSGTTDSLEYCRAKEGFIKAVVRDG